MANFSDDDSELVHLALLVKDKAYNPYSNFRVGACVQTSTGKMFTGCSVDNAVYPLSTCAERVAITTAVSEGEKIIIAIAIASDVKDHFITPCGGCRQIIAEFGYSTKCRVILVKSSGEYKRTNIVDLLPDL